MVLKHYYINYTLISLLHLLSYFIYHVVCLWCLRYFQSSFCWWIHCYFRWYILLWMLLYCVESVTLLLIILLICMLMDAFVLCWICYVVVDYCNDACWLLRWCLLYLLILVSYWIGCCLWFGWCGIVIRYKLRNCAAILICVGYDFLGCWCRVN